MHFFGDHSKPTEPTKFERDWILRELTRLSSAKRSVFFLSQAANVIVRLERPKVGE